ncbi:MAG: hypothetical protein NXI00_22570 [Cytophagales bacterium]|nr:hypothetical protein [Cytophagales bacterium]
MKEQDTESRVQDKLPIGGVSNSKRDPMFNYYWDWTDFSIGFSIAKPNKCTGWNWYISIDLTFLSVWWYF